MSMTYSPRGEQSARLFDQGYNCAQSVVVAWADVIGLPVETAARLSSGLGGGVSRLREVCGAVSGMAMVLGMVKGYSDPADYDGKVALYTLVQKLAEQFRQETGAVRCHALLGLPDGPSAPAPEPRTHDYYASRPCARFVAVASTLLERELKEQGLLTE